MKIISEKRIKEKSLIKVFKNNIIYGETINALKKMPAGSVKLIITSPSYEVGKEYEKGLSFNKYLKEHQEIIRECKRVLSEDGSIYWNVAQKPSNGEMLPLGAIFYDLFKKEGYFLKNWIIWRFFGGLNCKKRLSGRYENILWFVKDTENFIFNLDQIRIPAKWNKDKRNNPLGKNPTDFWEFENVWEINRVVNVSKQKTKHPCQFPEEMVRRIVEASSNEGDIVLDIFNGSGTTCKVANRLNRSFIGIDRNKKYCKIALKRIKGK